jgi:hypothetical protein
MFGTRGRTRTGTPSLAVDFESTASTNFATLAWFVHFSVTNYAIFVCIDSYICCVHV